MKHSKLIIIFIFAISVNGQNYKALKELYINRNIPDGQAIIYGNFIQRLGFSSGGFPQDIRLINLETKEILTFTVKPTLKSAKENTFAYYINPGKYAILNYWYTQSKWYGGTFFTEPVYKNIEVDENFEAKIKSDEIKVSDLLQFTFVIKENSLNYLGTWHFDKKLVSFTDDKTQLDKKIKSRLKKLDFSIAQSVIPN